MRFVFVVLLAVFSAITSQAQVSHLDAEIKKTLLTSGPEKEVYTVKEIPAGVLKACGFMLANPGEDWQVGCSADGKLLGQRLIWAAVFPKYVVLHYEHGGIAHSYLVTILAKEADGEYRTVWKANSVPLQGYHYFHRVLEGKALDDSMMASGE